MAGPGLRREWNEGSMSVTKEPKGDRSERESAGTDRKGPDYIGWPIRNPRETRERVGYFGPFLITLYALRSLAPYVAHSVGVPRSEG